MNAYDDPARLLTTNEAAELLQVSPDFIGKEIRLGRLAAYRVGREWRVSREQLETWLNMVESRSKVA